MSGRAPKKAVPAKKRPKTAAKTAAPRTRVTPEKVVQAHGGALLAGGMPGNRGGAGRPPSVVRQSLLGSIADRVPMLESIMDGEPIQKSDIPFMTIMKFARCPACGDKLTTDMKLEDQLMLTIEGKVSASPRDRLSAWDTAAKYGLGALKDVSTDTVRECLNRSLDIIQELVSPEQYTRIVKELQPVWST